MPPTFTPNLGLLKPDFDDAADVRAILPNFDTLDQSVTLTGVQTLSGKTLTNPVMNGSTRLLGDVYDANNNLLFKLTPPQPAAVNYFQFIGGAAGNGGSFALQGADAKGQMIIGVRGQATDAEANLETGAQINLTGAIEGPGGLNNILQCVPGWDGIGPNQGVNFLRVQSSSAAVPVRVLGVGPGVAGVVDLTIGCQHLGTIRLGANMGNNKILVCSTVASSLEGVDLNNVRITNALTGSAPILATEGADANVDLTISPKGTGAVKTTAPLLVNAAANGFNLKGATIDQLTGDDEILSFWSTGDVAHGITTPTATVTFGAFKKQSAASGGLRVTGFSAATMGLALLGAHTTDDAAKSTAGLGAVNIAGQLKSAATVGDQGANANIVSVRNNGTTRFLLDADGDSHQDVGTAWTNFDDYDDPALLTALSVAVSRDDDPIRARFGAFLDEQRDALARSRLVTFNADGHHFVNMSRLTMALVGAVRQQADQIAVLRDRLALGGGA